MAKEILVVPESKLLEVIHVIRAGLEYLEAMSDGEVTYDTEQMLRQWCDEEEKYIRDLG
jgi:hypothetical protein